MSNNYLTILLTIGRRMNLGKIGEDGNKRSGDTMTKMGLITTCMAVVYSVLLGYIFYQIGTMNPREGFSYVASVDTQILQMEEVEAATVDEEVLLPELPEEITYMIREHDSRIGVFQNGELIRIVNVDLTQLRERDARMLREGISAASLEEVAEILEDYTS